MTNQEAIQILEQRACCMECVVGNCTCADCDEAFDMAIKALEQEPSGDLISREWLKTAIHNFYYGLKHTPTEEDIQAYIDVAPSVKQEPKSETVTEFADRCRECGAKYGKLLKQEPNAGHCKDCKYFEYDSVAKVDGVPLIVAHEICKRWGDGCKTKEDGYCFLYEPQERNDKE